MGNSLLIILVSIIFAGCDCKMKLHGKNISEGISDDDEMCSKGKSWRDPSLGFMQNAVSSMFSSKKTVEPKFLCFSCLNDQEPWYVTNANFTAWDEDRCSFDPSVKTVFIMHGYKDGYAPWTRKLKDALLLREDCNVFIVECGHPSETYRDSIKNIPEDSKQVAVFIRNLMKSKGLNLRHVHIIGHSTAAHAAGFVGKYIKKTEKRTVGRITGLDPAGPDFYDATRDQRLDATDASFVDIIHTNGGCSRLEGSGYPHAVGHFDFYVNGGKIQPGCLTMSQFLGKMDLYRAKILFGYVFGTIKQPELDIWADSLCSHARSEVLFTASILNESCKLRSVQCRSWKSYVSGHCDDNEKVEMGYYADRYKDFAEDGAKKFYIEIAADPPYC